jgi:hypothetical protein
MVFEFFEVMNVFIKVFGVFSIKKKYVRKWIFG